MNKNNSHIPVSGNAKNITRVKSLTPAVLGIPSSHGAKLSLHMASEDKKQLLTKLEEWRKIRKEKLAASILAKMNQSEKQKPPVSAQPVKPKPLGDFPGSKIQDRQSVFERLYNNNKKIKKPEVSTRPSFVPKTNFRKSALPIEKISKPIKAFKDNDELKATNSHLSDEKGEEATSVDVSPQHSHHSESHVDGHTQPIFEEKFSELVDLEQIEQQLEENQIQKPEPTKPNEKNCSELVDLGQPESQLKENQIKKPEPIKHLKSLPFKIPVKPTETEAKPIRRSLSMVFRQKRKTEFAVRRSMSAKNLNEMKLNVHKPERISFQPPPKFTKEIVKPTKNDLASKSVSFVTPKTNKSLTSTHLRTKLENWLKVNGHPLDGYRHLRCFGISHDKSFPETPKLLDNALDNSQYETAPNTPADESNKENLTPPTVIAQQVDVTDVENWLKELHRLIVEVKYPSERCEEWLTAIRKKCGSCTQLPIYWECLAALHESKGDLKSAIEDYERAIIKGGEVDVVGNSLAQLFDKMVIEQKKGSNRKLERGLDPKNIFKSTIIKFALQQKALKKLSSEMDPNVREQLYIATPVRRSARVQTPYKSKEVSSLQTLSPEVLKNVTFKPNESLLQGE